ncbi:hypothetical protein ARMGADRAFT_969351 [Armillaria gallica]|uniref:Heterokaryon incompatibility domain-containing protein n=1 Tax=Armillaria gallica TaxID=47427 RepID=A0A2H3D480_ARMGA|nr:hypothetical protein ARMGADRAFT_969351 [Armillaria gallica]
MEKQSSSNADAFVPYKWPPRDISLPEITISAFTEIGQLTIVPKQQAYTSRMPVISSHLADTPCATLGIQGTLDQLNSTLGTSYTLDTSHARLLEHYFTDSDSYDFGTIYSCLRQVWYHDTLYRSILDMSILHKEKMDIQEWARSKLSNIIYRYPVIHQVCFPDTSYSSKLGGAESILHKIKMGSQMRLEALGENQVINPQLPPRCVWDLYSNRVVPYQIMRDSATDRSKRTMPWPISHAWMDEKDRVDIWTPINKYQWPVPIPKDTSLDLIRIEMLNLGAEYAWLDVLCLRQVGGFEEDMHVKEWKVDVPTIGAVYQYSDSIPVVCYLSGLGLPVSLKEGDLDSDQSWFRHAWTLQEVGINKVFAGDTPDGPLHAKPIDENGNYETKLLTRFHKQLTSMHHISYGDVFAALKGMQYRVSTNPVDKVAGLAFCLGSKTIPSYDGTQSLEEAWTVLVNSMHPGHQGKLFSEYPEAGNAGTKWRPSWDQIMTNLLIEDGPFNSIIVNQRSDNKRDCDALCIEEGFIQGLAVVKEVDRHGELIVKDKKGVEHAFDITATHKHPIPDDMYTLICTTTWIWRRKWVIGRRLSGRMFEKVTVLELANEAEWNRLRKLHITQMCHNILI